MLTERVCDTTSPRSTGSTDTVDIGLRDIRDIVVDHVFESVDVDPTRGDIGRDEHTSRLLFEVGECSLSVVLRLVPVDCFCRYPLLDEELRHLVRSMLGLCKYEYILDTRILEDMYHKWIFVDFVHMIDMLGNRLSRSRHWRDLYFEGIFEHAMCESRNSGSHSR